MQLELLKKYLKMLLAEVAKTEKQIEEEKLFQETSHIKDLITNSGYEPIHDRQENLKFPLFR